MHDMIGQRLRLLVRAWRYRLKLDRDEIRFLRRHLRKGDVAIDIGAHKGAYTYWMRRCVGGQGRVVAFEPQELLAANLAAITQAMRWDRVAVERSALSSRIGTGALKVPAGGPSPSTALVVGPDRVDDSDDEHAVPVDTLDHYVCEHCLDAVHLIKCDVEGHELDVFRGASDTLARHRPALLFECERRHGAGNSIGEVFSFLNGAGYDGSFFLRGKRIGVGEFDPDQLQVPGRSPYVNNFVFVHREPMDSPS